MRGGFGQAGRFRHKKSRIIRENEFIGKKGFVSVAQKRPQKRTLNLGQLSEMVDRLLSDKQAHLEGKRVIVDLAQLGYSKLLGKGSVTRPMVVKVDQCSGSALKKIQDAGGEATTSSPSK